MTVFGHAALGATVYGALRPHTSTTRWGLSRRALLLLCLLLPMVPDADVVMHYWVKYGHDLGHRGVSHSLIFALIFALGLAWLLQRLGYAERTRRALGWMTLAFALLLASHSVTDAMTTGGKAPSLLWPVKSEGVWFPKRFIPVSPMGSGLLRTKWTAKQIADMKKKRAKLLRGTQPQFMVVRKVVSLSKRPDHYRRLALAGIVLTELLLLAPFGLVVVVLAVWRRWRLGPAAKDPPRVRPPPQAPPAGPPARLWLAVVASGVALAAAVVVGIFVRQPDAGLSITRGHLDDDVSTHYRRVAPAQGDADSPVAVLFHGWRCSHQMMMPLARMLARNGVEVWAVDLPGHGRSPTALESGCRGRKQNCQVSMNRLFTDAATSIVEHLVEAEGLAGRDVVIIGHSTGAVAVHDLNVDGQAAESLAGRVVIEGRYKSLTHGGNRLIVGKKKYVQKHGDRLKPDVVHGSFADRSATELFTANRPHLALIYDAHVNDRILRWIASATGASVGEATKPHRKRYIAWAIVCAALGLALTTLGAAYATRRGWLPPVRPSAHARPGVAFVCVVFGSVAAVLWAGELFRAGGPWLQATIGQVLPTYLMCASVCIAIPYIVLTRRPGRPQLRSLAVDAAFAVLVFATIYLTVGLAVDRYFFHVGVPAWRWIRVFTWAVAFLPISLVVHEIGFASDRWWARIASVLVHAVIWGGLFWVEAVSRGQVADAKRFLAVVVIAELWALCVGWRRQSRFFAALVSSLVLAWILAAVYPILAGAPGG
jgi:inner membrane protein